MMHDWWGGPGMVFGPLLMLLWFGLLVWIAALIVRAVMSRGTGSAASPSYVGPTARQILDERFARGEIDEAEYTARHRVLGPGG